MAVDSVQTFRERVSEDSSLQAAFLEAFQQGPAALVALAKAQGLDFTEAEAEAAIAEISQNGELSDFELELVSGGIIRGTTLPGSVPTSNVTVNLDTGVSTGGGYTSPPPPPPPPPPSSGGGK